MSAGFALALLEVGSLPFSIFQEEEGPLTPVSLPLI